MHIHLQRASPEVLAHFLQGNLYALRINAVFDHWDDFKCNSLAYKINKFWALPVTIL